MQLPTLASPTRRSGSSLMITPGAREGDALNNLSSLDESSTILNDADWMNEQELLRQQDEDERLARSLDESDQPLAAWLSNREDDCLSASNQLRVENPTVVHKMFGRTSVEYTVQTQSASAGGGKIAVKRRYRDFVALHDALEIRYPGAIVPPLPKQTTFGKTDEWFVKKRTLLLEHFLSAVSRHPFLSGDDIYVEFIASSEKFDRKEVRAANFTINMRGLN